MSYFQGFLTPALTAERDGYRAMSMAMVPLLADYGAMHIVEGWAADVPDGTRTDMKRAVALTDDETVVFSWIRWPDRATCDAAAAQMMNDERMTMPERMPFDPQRLIYGGFEPIAETGPGGDAAYVDGVVCAVKEADRAHFVDHATAMGALFVRHGATRVVDGWGVDVPEGKVTDFRRAVAAGADEAVVFGWVEWPDAATREAGWAAAMADPAMRDNPPPWNGPTAIFGGFVPLVSERLR
jgi:uncharacterized protein YbaA (DUF1428 family)